MLAAYAVEDIEPPTRFPQFKWETYYELRRRMVQELRNSNWHPGPTIRSGIAAIAIVIACLVTPLLWGSAGWGRWLLAFIYVNDSSSLCESSRILNNELHACFGTS